MFSNTVHCCIIIAVSNQSKTSYQSLPIYQNLWFSFGSKSFSKMSLGRRFLCLLKIMAPTF